MFNTVMLKQKVSYHWILSGWLLSFLIFFRCTILNLVWLDFDCSWLDSMVQYNHKIGNWRPFLISVVYWSHLKTSPLPILFSFHSSIHPVDNIAWLKQKFLLERQINILKLVCKGQELLVLYRFCWFASSTSVLFLKPVNFSYIFSF